MLQAAATCPVALANWVPPMIEKNWNNPLLGGPFDGNDEEGQPLIAELARTQVLQRLFPALYSNQPQGNQPGQHAAPAKPR